MNEISTIEPPKQPTELILTDEQQRALDSIYTFWADPLKKEFKLGGYAGTGKTTVIKALMKLLQSKGITYSVNAFTGKACDVLQRKGVDASTLHSMLYNVEVSHTGAVSFYLRSRLEGNPSMIIVDEASMISSDLYRDLLTFRKKLLFVGDPGQLEPVGDNPNLMKSPDLVLSKIHRQAAESPIITLANNVRTGCNIPKVSNSPDLVIRDKSIDYDLLNSVDQVICAKNKTRTTLNTKVRYSKKLPAGEIVVGEKIIVLKNNSSFGVFNGMILFVTEIHDDKHPQYWDISAKDELGRPFYHLFVWKTPFKQPELISKDVQIPKLDQRQLVHCDYGYAITCHKSQGSEWGHVLVYDEWMPPSVWDMERWRYTAITRAAKKLTYCI